MPQICYINAYSIPCDPPAFAVMFLPSFQRNREVARLAMLIFSILCDQEQRCVFHIRNVILWPFSLFDVRPAFNRDVCRIVIVVYFPSVCIEFSGYEFAVFLEHLLKTDIALISPFLRCRDIIVNHELPEISKQFLFLGLDGLIHDFFQENLDFREVILRPDHADAFLAGCIYDFLDLLIASSAPRELIFNCFLNC